MTYQKHNLFGVDGRDRPILLAYGNGCRKHPDCFTCREKDCRGTSSCPESAFYFPVKHSYPTTKGGKNNGVALRE